MARRRSLSIMRIDAILNPKQPHKDKLRNLPLQNLTSLPLAHDDPDPSASLASCIAHNPRGRLIIPTSSAHQATVLNPDGCGGPNTGVPNAFVHDDTFPDPPEVDSFPSVGRPPAEAGTTADCRVHEEEDRGLGGRHDLEEASS